VTSTAEVLPETGPIEGAAAAVWVHLDKLTTWAQNPKKHEKREDICNSLIEFGWGRPLLARAENAEMIAGHGTRKGIELLLKRWKKAKPDERARWHPEAAHTAQTRLVPVRYMSLDERKAHLYAIADNRLSEPEKAPWDVDLLSELVAEFKPEEMELAGWTSFELERLFKDDDGASTVSFDINPADDQSDKAKTDFAIIIECKNEREQLELIEKLEGDGIKCRALT
jgi:hypothetical protein